MSEKEETVVISARIPKSLYEKLLDIIERGGFLNVSDFLRYLIRYYIQYRVPIIYSVEVKSK